MPAVPKPASTRRGHRNHGPRVVLSQQINPTVPDLPEWCDWHPAVREWWHDAWCSPMPQEWLEADRHNMLLAARGLQIVWADGSSHTARMTAMAETRLVFRELGLTPMARRTLQIEINRGEEAEQQIRERRNKRAVAAVPDPRAAYPTG